MITLLTGKKGSGKTKKLIDMANAAVERSNGNVVVIEKGLKLTYDISHTARLIDIENYDVKAVSYTHLDVYKRQPQVERHISTQTGIVNFAAAQVCWELGAKRVVLAREVPLSEIRGIRENADPGLELEAFVHGAMCKMCIRDRGGNCRSPGRRLLQRLVGYPGGDASGGRRHGAGTEAAFLRCLPCSGNSRQAGGRRRPGVGGGGLPAPGGRGSLCQTVPFRPGKPSRPGGAELHPCLLYTSRCV